MRTHSCIVRCLQTATIGLWLTAGSAHAQSLEPPVITPVGTDSYTVSYELCSGCVAHGLEESVDATGIWTGVGSGTQSFSQRAPATYRYRAIYVYQLAHGSYSTYYGQEASIAIEAGGTDSSGARPVLTEQFRTEHEILLGDADLDGRADLLIASDDAGAGGTISNLLLRNDGQGSFVPEFPSDYLLASSLNWAPADVDLVTRDVNIDGYADLVLRGVDRNPGLAGVSNQIVFAPRNSGTGEAPGIRAADAKLREFSRDINRHLIDPDYYPENVPLSYAVYEYFTLNCSWGAFTGTIDYYSSWPCYFEPHYVFIVYRDLSMFDSDAMDVASSDYGMIYGSRSINDGMARIESTLESVLETDIGGWSLDEIIGPEGEPDDDVIRGMELFSVLAGISEAVAQEVDEEIRLPENDRVLLKGRRVLGQGPFHTALEYQYETVSAYDTDPHPLFDGYLFSEVNWSRDHPSLTLRLGYVDGPAPAAFYWASIRGADGRYDDDLRYDLFPSIGEGGYNSNSYVAGLIQVTSGRPTVQMSTFVGGERPVPASEFY